MSECPLRNDNSPVSKCSKLLLHCSLKLRFTSPGLVHQGLDFAADTALPQRLQLELTSFIYLACLIRASASAQILGIAPARPCPTPRLASSFRADSIPSIHVASVLQLLVGETILSTLSVLVSLSAGSSKRPCSVAS